MMGNGGPPNVTIHNNAGAAVGVSNGLDGKDLQITIDRMVKNAILKGDAGRTLQKDFNVSRRGAGR
jgi:hypothetical protein